MWTHLSISKIQVVGRYGQHLQALSSQWQAFLLVSVGHIIEGQVMEVMTNTIWCVRQVTACDTMWMCEGRNLFSN